jgi:hypothetical protein
MRRSLLGILIVVLILPISILADRAWMAYRLKHIVVQELGEQFDDATVYQVGLCDLVYNAARYKNKLVRVEGYWSPGLDSVEIYGTGCMQRTLSITFGNVAGKYYAKHNVLSPIQSLSSPENIDYLVKVDLIVYHHAYELERRRVIGYDVDPEGSPTVVLGEAEIIEVTKAELVALPYHVFFVSPIHRNEMGQEKPR